MCDGCDLVWRTKPRVRDFKYLRDPDLCDYISIYNYDCLVLPICRFFVYFRVVLCYHTQVYINTRQRKKNVYLISAAKT